MTESDGIAVRPATTAADVLEVAVKDVPIVQVIGSPDPTYTEPLHPEDFEASLANGIEPKLVIPIMLARLRQLEGAVMPAAAHSMMIAHARMALDADGQKDAPAGGTWVSHIKTIQIQTNEGMFYYLCDVLGRAKVEAHLMATFERMQAAAKLAKEKEKHVAEGGVVH